MAVGARVIDRLLVDLRRKYPDNKGFSSSNLKYMRKLTESCTDKKIDQDGFHNCLILDNFQDAKHRHWYIPTTATYSWSLAVLVREILSRTEYIK